MKNSSLLTPHSSLNETVYSEFYGKVYGYILSKINNPQDAEDLTADVFVKIYAKLDTFDENKASLSTWIYTVTRNTLPDYYRTRQVFFEMPEAAEDDASTEDDICNAEAFETLANALESLSKRERDIIILHYYTGKTLKEIAERLGISYSYVKNLQNKALEHLQKNYKNKQQNYSGGSLCQIKKLKLSHKRLKTQCCWKMLRFYGNPRLRATNSLQML